MYAINIRLFKPVYLSASSVNKIRAKLIKYIDIFFNFFF